jgi:pyruvate carboxylase
MVQNNLTEQDVLARASTLSFPSSVTEYFQGYLGIPPFGFPENLRSKVISGKKLQNGKECFTGRPGAEMTALDFDKVTAMLKKKYNSGVESEINLIKEQDVQSYVQYPKVFEEYMEAKTKYGDLSVLDTRTFVEGMSPQQEVSVEIEKGKTFFIKLKHVSEVNALGFREAVFDLNGTNRIIKVVDKKAGVKTVTRPKKDPLLEGSVGAPMPGVIIAIKVAQGDKVTVGDPIVVLSAMKMETMVTAPVSGIVKAIHVTQGNQLAAGDLIVEIDG